MSRRLVAACLGFLSACRAPGPPIEREPQVDTCEAGNAVSWTGMGWACTSLRAGADGVGGARGATGASGPRGVDGEEASYAPWFVELVLGVRDDGGPNLRVTTTAQDQFERISGPRRLTWIRTSSGSQPAHLACTRSSVEADCGGTATPLIGFEAEPPPGSYRLCGEIPLVFELVGPEPGSVEISLRWAEAPPDADDDRTIFDATVRASAGLPVRPLPDQPETTRLIQTRLCTLVHVDQMESRRYFLEGFHIGLGDVGRVALLDPRHPAAVIRVSMESL